MPRLTITTLDGFPLAKGVYPLTESRLLWIGACRDMIPAGAFLRTPSELVSPTYRKPDGLWLSHREILGQWPRTETFCGCCGPDGSLANILHPCLNEPVAYEEADCHTNRSIHLASGTWREEIESDENGETWIGLVSVNASGFWPIGAACGRDEKEARFRLAQACAAYTDSHWSRRSRAWRRQYLVFKEVPAHEWLLE